MKCRLVGLATIVLAVISGCTANLAHRVTTTAGANTSAVLPIAQAWSAQHGAVWSSGLLSTAPSVWTTATAVIVPGTQSLTSYSSATGAQQWSVQLPEPICTIAPAPNSAGIGAILMGKDALSDRDGCGRAGAVDTRTGRLLWTTSLKGRSKSGLTDVAIGPSAVVATSPCDTAVTLAVGTGKVLVTLPVTPGKFCYNSWASDGTTLVLGQKTDPQGGLVGYDAVSGRRLWTVRSHADDAHSSALTEVHQVISSDPLVVEASVNQQSFLRTVDPKAGTATAFGREGSSDSVSTFVRTADGRLVVQYGQSSVLFTYDLGTGRQTGRVVLAANERFIGLRDGAAITVSTGDATVGSTDLVVRATDVATGVQRMLGIVTTSGVSVVSGNTLVVQTGDAFSGYHLPTSGPLASSLPDPVHWLSGDVRTKQAVDLCTGITATTTRAFGFLPPTHAAPADCRWVEFTSANVIVQLGIGSSVSAPTATKTAVAVARSLLVPSATANAALTKPLAGVGDEATMTSTTGATQSVTIVVRRLNVVVTLHATSQYFKHTPATAVAFLQHALRLAALDVVAEVDRRH